MLSPVFSNIPLELTLRPNWVVFSEKKVPFCATVPKMPASSIDPATWSIFEQARTTFEKGGFSGVGFVLDGTGIVGVDLDKCVVNGVPDPVAMSVLDSLGCAYVELSPSGSGLRAFGYGPSVKGVRGKIDGISIELYTTGRYLTVTGHILRSGPLMELDGFADLVDSIRGGATEKYRDDSSHISVSSVLSVDYAIIQTLPSADGERNHCLFEFARMVKSICPNATTEELRSVVLRWHKAALPKITTKEFTISWCDFLRAHESVRFPHGTNIKQIVGDIDMTLEAPSRIEKLGYGEKEVHLFRICERLQKQAGRDPFFLSCRQAGELIGTNFLAASKMLRAFRADGVLDEVSKGAGLKASRYRLISPV